MIKVPNIKVPQKKVMHVKVHYLKVPYASRILQITLHIRSLNTWFKVLSSNYLIIVSVYSIVL